MSIFRLLVNGIETLPYKQSTEILGVSSDCWALNLSRLIYTLHLNGAFLGHILMLNEAFDELMFSCLYVPLLSS